MNLNSIRLKQQMLDKIKIITSNAEKNLSVVDYQYNWFDSITENMRITHKNIEDYAYMGDLGLNKGTDFDLD